MVVPVALLVPLATQALCKPQEHRQADRRRITHGSQAQEAEVLRMTLITTERPWTMEHTMVPVTLPPYRGQFLPEVRRRITLAMSILLRTV